MKILKPDELKTVIAHTNKTPVQYFTFLIREGCKHLEAYSQSLNLDRLITRILSKQKPAVGIA